MRFGSDFGINGDFLAVYVGLRAPSILIRAVTVQLLYNQRVGMTRKEKISERWSFL